jgi:hypothetical protein
MRKASCLFAFVVTAFILFSSLHAAAQQPAKAPACPGGYNIVRVSEINPGMMDKFVSAVAAQKAWYKKIGAPDEISMLRILDTSSGAYSSTEALTMHEQAGSGGPNAPHDADYDAFVAMFKASSKIKSQYVACPEK